MDPLQPSVRLLAKLGSIAVHTEEYLSDQGHTYDRVTIQDNLDDHEVQKWLEMMGKMALIPMKR